MITPYIYGGAALAAVAIAGWVIMLKMENSDLSKRVGGLKTELSVQKDIVEQREEAAQVAEDQRQKESARVDKLSASLEALLTGDLANADMEIDPRITYFLECMRRDDPDEDCDTLRSSGSANPGTD